MKAEMGRELLEKLLAQGNNVAITRYQKIFSEFDELERLAAKGLRAERAEREIEADLKVYRDNLIGLDDKHDAAQLFGTIVGYQNCLDRLKVAE